MTFVNLYIGVKFQMSILRYTTGIFLIMSKGGICLENFKWKDVLGQTNKQTNSNQSLPWDHTSLFRRANQGQRQTWFRAEGSSLLVVVKEAKVPVLSR